MQLEYPDDNGVPLREHLEQIEKTTGIKDERLYSVKVPRGVEHLWEIFWNSFAGGPPTVYDLKIYLEETGWKLNSYEFIILIEMLREYHLTIGELSRKAMKGK